MFRNSILSAVSTMTLTAAPHPRLDPATTEPSPTTSQQQTEKDVESDAETNHLCCPNCGFDITPARPDTVALQDAQKQIADLQAQVRLLNEKATAAVDKWADYEDELQALRRQLADSANARAQTPTSQPASTSRFSFLSPRKSVQNLPTPSHSPHPSVSSNPSTSNLLSSDADIAALRESLEAEKKARKEAETKLTAASAELEDLTAQLFEQANEMVATERKERRRLEERIEVLERRDKEKIDRLGRLEGAVGRVERVKGLLAREDGTRPVVPEK